MTTLPAPVGPGLVASLWATEADLPTGPAAPAAPAAPWTWPVVLSMASDLLYEATGRQWRGTATATGQILAYGHDGAGLLPGWVPIGWAGGTWIAPPCPGVSGAGWGRAVAPVAVALPSPPVTSLPQITIDGVVLDPGAYRCDRAGLLERVDGQCWPVDGTAVVTWTWGDPPPPQGKACAVTLAIELAKALPGSGLTSRLRRVVETVNREGVSIAAKDLTDELKTNPLAALDEVALFVGAYNPHGMRQRGSCWSPDMGRVRGLPVT